MNSIKSSSFKLFVERFRETFSVIWKIIVILKCIYNLKNFCCLPSLLADILILTGSGLGFSKLMYDTFSLTTIA